MGDISKMCLHDAVLKGEKEQVQLLLDDGADVNTENIDGSSPLHLAVKNKFLDVAELLILRGANVNAKDRRRKTALFYAIQEADLKLTYLLLFHKTCISDEPEYLIMAVGQRLRKTVELLITHGVDVNLPYKGSTALHVSVSMVDHNDEVERAFALLADSLSGKKRKALQTRGTEARVTKLLLNHGANVNAPDTSGLTALHIAVWNEQFSTVGLLVEYKADVNISDMNGVTPLHLSVENSKLCEMLLTYGADIHTPINSVGRPSVRSALGSSKQDIRYYNIFLYDLLKIRKARLSYYDFDLHPDDRGMTALHIAAMYGKYQSAQVLLENGADINLIDSNCLTAYQLSILISHWHGHGVLYNDKAHRNSLNLFVTEQFLGEHVSKLAAIDRASVKNLEALKVGLLGGQVQLCQKMCTEELKSMKSIKIAKTDISMYDYFTREHVLGMLVRNKDFVSMLKTPDFAAKYPAYTVILRSNIKTGLERIELLKQIKEPFASKIFDLPDLCTDEILRYLSNEDLVIFLNALKNFGNVS